MEIVRNNIIILIISFSSLFSNEEFNYKIKYFGIHVADCSISSNDTLFNNNTNSKKIIFDVKTKPFFNFFFPINNKYSILLNKENRILSFTKDTNQPEIENFLKTEMINDKVFYNDSDFEILPNYYNIFSVLYIIMSGGMLPECFIMEREGLVYNSSINLDEEKMMYTLDFKKIEGDYYPVIPNTDIFTWAVFMENAQRKIFINSKTKIIEKCIFSKGLITISAHLNP